MLTNLFPLRRAIKIGEVVDIAHRRRLLNPARNRDRSGARWHFSSTYLFTALRLIYLH